MKAGNTMLSKNQIKVVRSLQSKKHRQKYQKFTVEGEKIVREVIVECPERLEGIIVVEHAFRKEDFHVPEQAGWWETDERTMKELSSMQTPPGIIAIIQMPFATGMPEDRAWLLYLDGIRDPGNLGTILRTADWFGFQDVLLGPGTVEWSNPKVVQASMGSILRIRCHDIQPEDLSIHWPKHPCFAAQMDGQVSRTTRWPDRGILMMGSESHGLTSLAGWEKITSVTIKKDPGSRAESLNVATAAGILMNLISSR